MNRQLVGVLNLIARQKEQAGVAAAYTREAGKPGEVSASVVAIPFREESAATGPGGTIARHESTDREYLIDVAELVLGGAATVPKLGDQIAEVDGGGVVWEIRPKTGEKAWDYHDTTRTLFRVRAVRA